MTFLAPWMFVAGIAAALGVVGVHLLTTRRPPAAPLPTARFVPEGELRAVARASRPTDLLLLALRAFAVLAIGAAFARPVWNAPGPKVRSVIALEWTRGVRDVEQARALARGRLEAGDALVLFDTAASEVQRGVLDTLSLPDTAPRVGMLSPMFVAARDAAATIARGADSVRLVVIATVGAGGIDAATEALRATWPGRVELVPLAGVADTARSAAPELVTTLADDPLVPALAALAAFDSSRGAHAVRIVRSAPTARDSAWVTAQQDGVLVVWPSVGGEVVGPDGVVVTRAGSGPERSAGASLRTAAIVAPLARLDAGVGNVVARWRDGAPAVRETYVAGANRGCIRTVGIGIPRSGDVTLRQPFRDLLAALIEPCGGRVGAPPPAESLTWLTRTEPLATGASLARAVDDTLLTRWLLVLALGLLVIEQLVRRRGRAGGIA